MSTPAESAQPLARERTDSSVGSVPPVALVAGIVVAAVALVATVGPLLLPDPYEQDLANALAGASVQHPLGTDSLGRDILARLVAGARYSLLGPLVVVGVATVVGVPLGLLAGYRRGITDAVLGRTWDVMFVFPVLLLAIVVIAVFGTGFWPATLAIAVGFTPLLARVVRSLALAEREKPYISACEIQGFSTTRTVFAHVLPNVKRPLAAQLTLCFGYALLDLAGLAFLGLGVQPPTPEWGQMLNVGRDEIVLGSYTQVISATAAIAVTVVAVNLLGDHLANRRVTRTL